MHLLDICCTIGRISEKLDLDEIFGSLPIDDILWMIRSGRVEGQRVVVYCKEETPHAQSIPQWAASNMLTEGLSETILKYGGLLMGFSCHDLLSPVFRCDGIGEGMTFFKLADTLMRRGREKAKKLQQWFFVWKCPEHDKSPTRICLANVIGRGLPPDGDLLNLCDAVLSWRITHNPCRMLFEAATHKNTELILHLFKTSACPRIAFTTMNVYTEEGEDLTWIGVLIKKLSVEHFQTLVSAGCMDYGMQHPPHNTALHQAVRCSNYEKLKILVSRYEARVSCPPYFELFKLSAQKSPVQWEEFCFLFVNGWMEVDVHDKRKMLSMARRNGEKDLATLAQSQVDPDMAAKDKTLGSSLSLIARDSQEDCIEVLAVTISAKFSHRRPKSLEDGENETVRMCYVAFLLHAHGSG